MKTHSKETARNSIRTRREMRLVLALLVLSSWLVFSASSFASESGKIKRIFVLCSFRYGLPANELADANDRVIHGIRTTFGKAMGDRVAFYTERMDISVLPDDRYFETLRDAYRKRYADQRIDLIVAVNFRALTFLRRYGEELWPNTPIVFSGVDVGRREQLEHLEPNITGVLQKSNMDRILDTILTIHPDVRRIAIVAGASETDKFTESIIRKAFRDYSDRVEIVYLNDLALDTLLVRLAKLPSNSVVFYSTMLADGRGNPAPLNTLPLVSQASNAPVYGLFDAYVGHGIVGGHVASHEGQGAAAAELALRILAGEKPGDIPFHEKYVNVNLFDWRQLERWGIDRKDLPEGSTILHQPPSFYDQYKWHIWGAVALIVVEAILINILMINRARRRRAERELQRTHHALLKSQEDFRNMAGKLLSVQESERRRLAREMHDDLTQRLAVLAIDIGKIEQGFQDTADPVFETLQSVREGLVNLSGDIHAISRQLHPSILEDLGLVDAVKSECSSFTQREGIAVDYRTENVPPGIPADVAICIYRIVQEGLRNVAKHADTTQSQVSLTGKDDSIHLMIKDQGAGFDPKEMEKKLGLGLVSMQERVRLIQGDISIESHPGKGTVIKARAPLKNS